MKKYEIRHIVKMEEIFEVSFADNNEEEENEENEEKQGNRRKLPTVSVYLDLIIKMQTILQLKLVHKKLIIINRYEIFYFFEYHSSISSRKLFSMFEIIKFAL